VIYHYLFIVYFLLNRFNKICVKLTNEQENKLTIYSIFISHVGFLCLCIFISHVGVWCLCIFISPVGFLCLCIFIVRVWSWHKLYRYKVPWTLMPRKTFLYHKLKDVKGVVRNCKSWNRQKVTKIKRTNIQIMINKTLHRKIKIEQHETYYNTRGNSCASDGKTIPALCIFISHVGVWCLCIFISHVGFLCLWTKTS
jgi:hypothetical protein